MNSSTSSATTSDQGDAFGIAYKPFSQQKTLQGRSAPTIIDDEAEFAAELAASSAQTNTNPTDTAADTGANDDDEFDFPDDDTPAKPANEDPLLVNGKEDGLKLALERAAARAAKEQLTEPFLTMEETDSSNTLANLPATSTTTSTQLTSNSSTDTTNKKSSILAAAAAAMKEITDVYGQEGLGDNEINIISDDSLNQQSTSTSASTTAGGTGTGSVSGSGSGNNKFAATLALLNKINSIEEGDEEEEEEEERREQQQIQESNRQVSLLEQEWDDVGKGITNSTNATTMTHTKNAPDNQIANASHTRPLPPLLLTLTLTLLPCLQCQQLLRAIHIHSLCLMITLSNT